jgi:predicted PurR-regulated permease PerM
MSQARPIAVHSQEPERTPGGSATALRWVVAVLCLGAFVAVVPFWAPLVLAAWVAAFAKPLHRALARRIHRRTWAAAGLTVVLVSAFLVPLLVATLSLSGAAVDLGHRLMQSGSGTEALRSLTAGGDHEVLDFEKLDMKQVVELGRRHGASALSVAKTLFGAATVLGLGVVVFVSAFYTFLIEGQRLHEWLLVHSPLGRDRFHRLSNCFVEVGRGLLIGVVLTAVLQAAVATVGYVVCGVPQALVLGLVTVFASLIPSIGSALVWLPVTAGLAVSGRLGAAAVMLAIGCVVSVIDNLVRPLLARYGELRMNGLLLFIAMLGGVAVFGATGLLLGPLLVRLAIEGLTMLREARLVEGQRSGATI